MSLKIDEKALEKAAYGLQDCTIKDPIAMCRHIIQEYDAAKVKEQPDADDKNVVNTPKNEAECGSNTIQPVQELVNLKVLGLSVQEIARLKSWFENKSGKNITEFWEEAFNAGIKTAGHLSQPVRESGSQWLLGQATAVAEGYPHLGAKTKDKPFARQ